MAVFANTRLLFLVIGHSLGQVGLYLSYLVPATAPLVGAEDCRSPGPELSDIDEDVCLLQKSITVQQVVVPFDERIDEEQSEQSIENGSMDKSRVQENTEEEVDEEEEFFKAEHEKEMRRRQAQKEKEDRDAALQAARVRAEKEAARVRAEKEAQEAERRQREEALELAEIAAQQQFRALGFRSDVQESNEEKEVDTGPPTQKQLVKRMKPIMHDMEMDNPEDNRTWIVVGDTGKGGILVRRGESLESALFSTRLMQGTQVEELDLEGNRLHYKRLRGDGPDFGWVNVITNDKVMMELEDLES
mmetsp:Transcript_23003/g.44191  ORF Transcript_23003/g.44191 Transcript_23003/m.44191 type:complete len:303 (-) Transcript_23003:26-934(-)